MSTFAEILRPLHGETTPYELQMIRICDALLQYQNGKYAGQPQVRIPAQVIAAALDAYDPAVPIRFGGSVNQNRARKARRCKPGYMAAPACPSCHGKRTVSDGRNRKRGAWKCYDCKRRFTQEAA